MKAIQTINTEVTEALNGLRLDKFLAQSLPELSRVRIQALINQQMVAKQPEGTIIDSIKAKVKEGEVYEISIPPLEELKVEAQNIPLEILFEDKHIIVLNKPAGIAVHPGAGNGSGTLVNALLYHCKGNLSGIGGVERPGIVHRLDKETSGVMVVAKSDLAHNVLSKMFEERTMDRHYIALCYGSISPIEGEIVGNIGRHPSNRKKMAVVADDKGRTALTYYTVLKNFRNNASLVELKLMTGRTHQIRVHLATARHSVLGDQVYGKPKNLKNYDDETNQAVRALRRQMLHAQTLGFRHPITKKELFFEADPPADMQAIIDLLSVSS